MSDSISEKITVILIEHLGVSTEQVNDDASLIDDLGADSLDLVKIQMMVEDEFGISIDDDDIRIEMTVGELVKLVEREKAEQA